MVQMGYPTFKYFSNLIFLQFHAKQDLSGGCLFPLTQRVSFLRPNSLIGLVYLPSIANLARVRQPAMIRNSIEYCLMIQMGYPTSYLTYILYHIYNILSTRIEP